MRESKTETTNETFGRSVLAVSCTARKMALGPAAAG